MQFSRHLLSASVIGICYRYLLSVFVCLADGCWFFAAATSSSSSICRSAECLVADGESPENRETAPPQSGGVLTALSTSMPNLTTPTDEFLGMLRTSHCTVHLLCYVSWNYFFGAVVCFGNSLWYQLVIGRLNESSVVSSICCLCRCFTDVLSLPVTSSSCLTPTISVSETLPVASTAASPPSKLVAIEEGVVPESSYSTSEDEDYFDAEEGMKWVFEWIHGHLFQKMILDLVSSFLPEGENSNFSFPCFVIANFTGCVHYIGL